MQIHDAAATRAALDFQRLIPALARMYVDGCEVPTRHVHTVPAPDGTVMTVLLMPAWQRGGAFGLKTVAIAPGNGDRGLPGLHSTYLLSDAQTGVPIATMDGDAITSCRTAAASALATSHLARPDARRLFVLGSGRVASLLPEAMRCVRPIDEVAVWSRRPAQAHAFAARLRAQGFEARVVDEVATGCAWADIVSAATLATDGLVQGAWLRPGSHLDLIGSFTPGMRESDDACWAGASCYVDTPEALGKSGDLIGPLARGVLDRAAVVTLEQLCRGEVRPTWDARSRTVFKAVGTGLADLAAALLVQSGARG